MTKIQNILVFNSTPLNMYITCNDILLMGSMKMNLMLQPTKSWAVVLPPFIASVYRYIVSVASASCWWKTFYAQPASMQKTWKESGHGVE